jgi:hypothetical protein
MAQASQADLCRQSRQGRPRPRCARAGSPTVEPSSMRRVASGSALAPQSKRLFRRLTYLPFPQEHGFGIPRNMENIALLCGKFITATSCTGLVRIQL